MIPKTTVAEFRIKGELVFTYTRLLGTYIESDVKVTVHEDYA